MSALIVDDNRINLMLCEEMLGCYDIAVHTADGGADALELAAGTEFDIVFLDYLMPDMDGFETCRRLRAMGGAYAAVPIIMITADDSGQLESACRLAGVTDCLSKPVEPDTLDAVMVKWLGVRSAQDGAAGEGPDEPYAWIDVLGGIEALDTRRGLELVKGNREAYLKMLKAFCRQIGQKEAQMSDYIAANDMSAYAIEAHSLKSSLNIIGAAELSERARALEAAADGGLELDGHGAFFRDASGLAALISGAVEVPGEDDRPAGKIETLTRALERALAAMDEFETDDAVNEIRAARTFSYDGGEYDERLEALEGMLDDYAYEQFNESAARLLTQIKS
ncbi:MAG: response regulator [Oscillospiraceae bacterium]|nr:response regulator [Oscillospiraceae bacterium]